MAEQDILEPVAIIGFSLKFPQDATDAESFWKMLCQGRSARTEIPTNRFNVDAHYDPDPGAPGMISYKHGHFINDDIASFDAPFFSMSPVEAGCLDPQQRGLLECAYRALENAGIPIEKASGTKTSVHIGSGTEYQTLFRCDSEMDAKYLATGSGRTIVANRISWFYNFLGPSIAVDTACSSSLNALHLACQALRSGDASMGLVGGANLFYDTGETAHFTHLGFNSPEGISYAFDHRANGYARGEGFAIVVIKMLSRALRDGDIIRAVIRSTGSNQDGRTPGITQPSSESQEMLIRETHERAGLDLKSTRFFESHGTGTQVGDALEAKAMGAVFGSVRSPEEPLVVGALKSSIGHLEATAGIAGLIKTVLVLENGVIPPNVWFEKRNPSIKDEWNLEFPTQPIPWPASGLRRASVNCFGFGGSNAHAILDDAYHYLKLRNLDGHHNTEPIPGEVSRPCTPTRARQRLFVWSSSDEGGLQRIAESYQIFLTSASTTDQDENKFLERLAFTLSSKRSALSWRTFITASTLAELQEVITTALPPPVRAAGSTDPKVAFILTGQGAQSRTMGHGLMEYFPVYRTAIEDASSYLRSLGCEWSLVDALSGDSSINIDSPEYSQPLCTAVQVALVDLLRSWSVFPSAVVGHSSGEIAAAYCIGGLSRESAWKVAYYRGVLSAQLARKGRNRAGMMAVALSEAAIKPYLSRVTGYVAVGCVNSPSNVTLTGSYDTLIQLQEMLRADKVFCSLLKVENAYHSSYMEELAPKYANLLQDLTPGTGPISPVLGQNVPVMFSTVTGQPVANVDLRRAEYWVRNLVSPVRFSDALANLLALGAKRGFRSGSRPQCDYLLEIGPHSALRRSVKDIANDVVKDDVAYDSLLTRGVSALSTVFSAMGRLWGHGISFDMVALNGIDRGSAKMLVNLPEYPFNHIQKHWIESRISKYTRFRKHPRNRFLGTPAPDWNPNEARWRMYLSVSGNPWIQEQRVSGSIVYPVSGMLVMAIEAARQLASPDRAITGYRFKSVVLDKTLIVPETEGGIEIQFFLRPAAQNSTISSPTWHECKLSSYENDEWVDNFHGSIQVEYGNSISTPQGEREMLLYQQSRLAEFSRAAKICGITTEADSLYGLLDMSNFKLGPSFQSLQSIRYNMEGSAVTSVKVRGEFVLDKHAHVIHPTILDGMLQGIFPAVFKGGQEPITPLALRSIDELWMSGDIAKRDAISASTHSRATGLLRSECSIVATDSSQSKLLLAASNLEVIAEVPSALNSRYLCYNIDWKPDVNLLPTEPELLEDLFSATETESLPPPNDFTTDMEFLAFYYLCNALNLVEKEMVIPPEGHLTRLLSWMMSQRERWQRGELMHGQPQWGDLIHDEAYVKTKMEIAAEAWEGKLLLRMGPQVIPSLRGEVDPLEVMFQDDLMKNVYRLGYGTDVAYEKAERYIDFLAHKNPNMKILEVGAGTGSITGSILHTLSRHAGDEPGGSRFQSYTFTDVSAAFFEDASQMFSEHAGRMDFKVFDLEHDPAEQGFESGTYDLVVAAGVVHVCEDLNCALSNVRRLLKPGGKLIMHEICRPDVSRGNLIFGLLPGWWLAREPERKLSPLLLESDWDRWLRGTGFTGTELILGDWEDPLSHMTSFMITTAADDTKPASPLPGKILIIGDEESSLQQGIAEQLTEKLKALGERIGGGKDIRVISLANILEESLSDTFCIFLVELERPFLANMDGQDLACLKRLVEYKRLLWLMQHDSDPLFKLVVGFSRCIQSEYGGLEFTTLGMGSWRDPAFVASTALKVIEAGGTAEEYAERNGLICINRVIEARYIHDSIAAKLGEVKGTLRLKPLESKQPMKLAVGNPGLLDTLHFVDDNGIEAPLGEEEVEIEVKATGMNLLDVSVVLAQVPNGSIGFECSGLVSKAGSRSRFTVGDRVFAACHDAYRTFIRTSDALVQIIPDGLSFEEAAALPIAYAVSYHALFDVARLRPGEKVLIHYGARRLGQAAIRLAQHAGAEVFTTVGSDEKRDLMKLEFGLADDHILSSRDITAFTLGIRRVTGGLGADVVLNSMTGEGLIASWECLAPFGRFVELGEKDIMEDAKLPMGQFSKGVSFAAVDFLHIMRANLPLARDILDNVRRLIVEGVALSPRPLQIFTYSDIEAAFREVQTGKHIGKVVAVPKFGESVPYVPNTRPSWNFDPNSTYLIAGGLGGVGRSMARRMAGRGAKNLVLLSRSGVSASDTAKTLITDLESLGCRVAAPPCDIANRDQLSQVLAEVSGTMPPIKGCIQGALVLRDFNFVDMTLDDFQTALAPKVHGSLNLHELLPQGMDFFIMLSSFSGIVGFPGQSNYCAGNTYQDALAKYRVSIGEKATAVDLGMILSVGFTAERPELARSLRSRGYMSIREQELLAVLEHHCDPSLPMASSLTAQVVMGAENPAVLREKDIDEPYWMSRPLFHGLYAVGAGNAKVAPNNNSQGYQNLGQILQNASSLEEAGVVMSDALAWKLARILSMPQSDITVSRPMHTYGVDSLVAVDMRNWLLKEVKAEVSAAELLKDVSITALGLAIAAKSQYLPAAARSNP